MGGLSRYRVLTRVFWFYQFGIPVGVQAYLGLHNIKAKRQ